MNLHFNLIYVFPEILFFNCLMKNRLLRQVPSAPYYLRGFSCTDGGLYIVHSCILSDCSCIYSPAGLPSHCCSFCGLPIIARQNELWCLREKEMRTAMVAIVCTSRKIIQHLRKKKVFRSYLWRVAPPVGEIVARVFFVLHTRQCRVDIAVCSMRHGSGDETSDTDCPPTGNGALH